MRSHQISQVVLNEFTDENKLVNVHGIHTRFHKKLSPYEIAYIDFDEKIIRKLEEAWCKDIETRASESLRVLKHGDLLHQPKHQKIIKALIALHFVRGMPLVGKMEEAKEELAAKIIADVTKAYPDHKELIEKQVAQEWPKKTKEAYPHILEENISKVIKFLDEHGLEIGCVTGNLNLIIGDSPVITACKIANGNLEYNVPITEATMCIMPLTPKHLVALKTHPDPDATRYIDLTEKDVAKINHLQKSQAISEFYSKP